VSTDPFDIKVDSNNPKPIFAYQPIEITSDIENYAVAAIAE
jgi:hypothetical protein